MKPVKLKLIGIISVFAIILITTIGYSALNTNLTISGEAHMRVSSDIRVSSIELVELTNGAYETYGNEYTKNTTSMHVTLPNTNSTAKYKVIVTNKTGAYFSPNEIVEQSKTNSNVTYELSGISSYDVYDDQTLTFYVSFSTKQANQKQDLVLEYNFSEITTSVWSFDYTGREQIFNVPYNADYKIETWGAQGGTRSAENVGGFGGYSQGTISLRKTENLYINIGGTGELQNGGYNGGGSPTQDSNDCQVGAGGGGATHIATKSGLLSTLSDGLNTVLIVSGGGGGTGYSSCSDSAATGIGGSGGGMSGNDGIDPTSWKYYYGTGATQTNGGKTYASLNRITASGTFGIGGIAVPDVDTSTGGSGGGGGFYGGGASSRGHGGAGGGSGYIGNTLLTNKVMYCYNCTESYDALTKTISTTNVSTLPTTNYAKQGNGYAKITLLPEKIKITDIELVSLTNGAYEASPNGYLKNTTKTNVTLPNTNSTATYKVTITNKTGNYFSLNELIESTNSNSNVKYTISGLEEKNVYQGSEYTFNITLSTSVANQTTNLVLKYRFEEVATSVWAFDYTGGEQVFNVPYTANYKIETWGAQGGHNENFEQGIGYGGYSTGITSLKNNNNLYINVGGKGSLFQRYTISNGGYNGGANGGTNGSTEGFTPQGGSGGGGATHIATKSGLLSTLSNSRDSILIVSGGGGGSTGDEAWISNGYNTSIFITGGYGGGYIGSSGGHVEQWPNYYATGGTQTSGGNDNAEPGAAGTFGQGALPTQYSSYGGSGGGGGYYGGGGSSRSHSGAGGGSGYIGNSLLTNKVMYCYNCAESSEVSTKTIKTTNVSSSPISNYAKKGNGYAKITLIPKN